MPSPSAASWARRSDDPAMATRRLVAAAAWATDAMRATLLPKEQTTTMPFASAKTWVKAGADRGLARGGPLAVGVRAVAEHEVDALASDLAEAGQVRGEADARLGVELPVAGVEDEAGGAAQREGDRFGGGMADGEGAHREGADLDRVRRAGRCGS